MDRDDVRNQVAELVAEMSDGQVPADAALAGGVPLTSLGLSSFGFVRLTDAVAARYGVTEGVDGDLWEPDAVDRIAGRILAARG